jgi:uncharacterized protein (TIGR04255 family)
MPKYSKPPLVEVICEFQFSTSVEWDPAIPGLMFEALQTEFPKRKVAKTFTVSFPSPEAAKAVPSDRLQFWSPDDTTLVQISPQLLAINRLAPYPGWEVFYPNIQKAVDAFIRVAPGIRDVKRVGLRYINRVHFPHDKVRLGDHFNFYPQSPEPFTSVKNFQATVDVELVEPRDNLRVQLHSIRPKGEGNYITLDLDYSRSAVGSQISFEECQQCLQSGHTSLDEAFEACITEELRATFR